MDQWLCGFCRYPTESKAAVSPRLNVSHDSGNNESFESIRGLEEMDVRVNVWQAKSQ